MVWAFECSFITEIGIGEASSDWHHTLTMINGKLKIIFIISKWDFGIIRENLARNDKQ